jgi:hypothetical protein
MEQQTVLSCVLQHAHQHKACRTQRPQALHGMLPALGERTHQVAPVHRHHASVDQAAARRPAAAGRQHAGQQQEAQHVWRAGLVPVQRPLPPRGRQDATRGQVIEERGGRLALRGVLQQT